MPAHALQLDPPEPDATNPLPWIVAAIAAIGLVLATSGRLAAIPASLERQTRAVIAAAAADAADGIEVRLDGRDVELAGTLTPDVDRAAMVEAIEAIDGVRVVRDELDVVDPQALVRAERRRFRDALAGIDTASVAFEPGSTAFTAGSEAALAALVQLMRDAPAQRIRVAGHTDNTGRPEVNLRISRERAAAVAAHLVGRGVDASRIVAQGYGATQPVADNASADGRARNRRIEISFID